MMPATKLPRLLFFVEHFERLGTGAENYAVSLCSALADAGYEVHVTAEDGGDVPGVITHTDHKRIPAIIDEVAPDLTIDWGFHHAADIHRIGGGVHSECIKYSLDAYKGLDRKWKELRNKQSKHRKLIVRETAMLQSPQAHFIANSKFVVDQAGAGGAAPNAVTLMYNGVDIDRFRPVTDPELRAAQRATWHLKEDDVVYLFVAHNIRLKNLELLCRVFETRTRSATGEPSQQPAKLVVVGKNRPAYTSTFMEYAGAEDAMEVCYQAADALLHPSYFDAGANVVLEAMSCGLPVIVSDRCGTDELVNHEESGYVLPVVGDTIQDLWAERINALTDDKALRQRLGTAGRKIAEQHTFVDYVNQFRKLLTDVLEKKKSLA